MRKNLLLLIMFCLIATIGAKAEVTSAVLSTDNSTLTITVTAAGDLYNYFTTGEGKAYSSTLTTLVINGPISSGNNNNNDLAAVNALNCITSLDLTNVTELTGDALKFHDFNYNNLSQKLKTIKFPKNNYNSHKQFS